MFATTVKRQREGYPIALSASTGRQAGSPPSLFAVCVSERRSSEFHFGAIIVSGSSTTITSSEAYFYGLRPGTESGGGEESVPRLFASTTGSCKLLMHFISPSCSKENEHISLAAPVCTSRFNSHTSAQHSL